MSREKKISAIEEVKISNATYEQNPQKFVPTFVNFFFGKNGSGKSTIAQNIYALTGTKWQDGYVPEDYTHLLYDADFIRDHMKSYEDLPGVFSVNKENIEIEGKIKSQQKIVEDETKAIGELEDKKNKISGELKSSFDKLKGVCWDKYKEEQVKFPKASITIRNKDAFAQTLLDIKNPAHYDYASLKTKYDAAFDETSHTHELFKTVTPILLKSIPGFAICKTVITSSSQTPFNEFMQLLGALKWVQDGHERFAEKAGDLCPYCHQILPKDYEDQLASCFDEKYEQNMRMLTEFCSRYEQEIGKLIFTLEKNMENPVPFLDLEQYNILLDNLRKTHKINLQKLESKKSDPASTIDLEELVDVVKKMIPIIKEFNAAITTNNKIVSDRKNGQNQCGEEIRSHIAHTLKVELDKYRATKKTAEAEIEKFDAEITAKKNIVKTAKHEIETLGKQVVNTKESIDNINAILENAGFQGFRIVEKSDKENAYEIIRDNGKPAGGLSEGERNFIMFLYFYQMVKGSIKSDDALKDKIVIIDDPVTSMDSGSVFVVGSLIREMVEICSHNIAWDLDVNDPYRIRQIFIFTHNTYFHRSITYQMDNPKYFDCVSFFLVHKDRINRSFIDTCIQDSTTVAHTKENYNPVKDTYEALWEEYQKATAPTPLLNVIRQIIEYYFLHTCSYSLVSMQEDISKPGIFLNEDGSENKDAQRLAKNMLSQIQNASNGLSSGIEYAENAEDAQAVKVYRDTFRDIFRALRQEQHYSHMVRDEQ